MAINLRDFTSNNNNLTNVGAAEVTTSLPFAASTIAVDLESTESDYLYILDASQTGLDPGNAFTIECWVKPESLPANGAFMGFVTKWRDTGGQASYYFGVYNNAGTYRLVLYTSSDGTAATGRFQDWTVSVGTWYHVATTHASDGTVQFFVNGSQVGVDQAATATIFNGTGAVVIGAARHDNTPNEFFDGVMDDVRIWNDVRSGAEISANYNVELVGNESNLVAYWPFEPNNLDTTDKTSNNNDLVNSGGVFEVVSGLPFVASTSAADFEATNSDYLYITDANQTGLDITGDLTLEGWFNFESTPSSGNVMRLITKRVDPSQYSFYFFLYNNGGTLQFNFNYSNDGSTVVAHSVAYTPTTGTWYHVAVVFTASTHTSEFFVNGSSIGTSSAGALTSIFNSTAPFVLGADESGNYFDGKMDDIRVWNDVRTSQEISDNKSIELSGNESNLVAYWPFETSYGTTTTSTSTSTSSSTTSTSSSTTSTTTFTSSSSTSTSTSSTSTSTSTSSSSTTSSSTSSSTTTGPYEKINLMGGSIYTEFTKGDIYNRS